MGRAILPLRRGNAGDIDGVVSELVKRVEVKLRVSESGKCVWLHGTVAMSLLMRVR